jgi:hypothetical protein
MGTTETRRRVNQKLGLLGKVKANEFVAFRNVRVFDDLY